MKYLEKIKKTNGFTELVFENKLVQWFLKPLSYNKLIWRFFVVIISEVTLLVLSNKLHIFFEGLIEKSTINYEKNIYQLLDIFLSGGSWIIVLIALLFTLLIFILQILDIRYQRKIDSRQLLKIDEFIDVYQYNKFATPLDIGFYGRDKDKSNIINLIASNNITFITGKAGVGKTKIVLEALKDFSKNSEYEPICVFNRNANLLEDIQSFFSKAEKYVIFIDDANRVHTAIDYLIQLYPEKIANNTLKIVLTVRNYAKEKIINKISDRTFSFKEYIINELRKEDINEILKNDFEITNPSYLERIEYLSKGNPRLAIMMAKIAKDTNDLNSISDISNIYERYFTSVNSEVSIFEDNDMLKVISIVAFYRYVDKSNNEQVKQIEKIFDIKLSEFWDKVKILHKLEIFDLHENEVVKVSDQILATYLFYKVVFIDGVLNIDLFISNFFDSLSQRLNDVIVPILNSFDNKFVIAELKISFDGLMQEHKNDNDKKYNLIKMFWYVDRTKSLLYLKGLIDSLTAEEVQEMNSEPYREHSKDNIIKLIEVLSNDHENYKEIIDLLFRYFKKNDFIYKDIFEILKTNFGFNKSSYKENYEIQSYIFIVISNNFDTEKTDILIKLLFDISKYYLSTVFDSTESDGKTVTFYNFKLFETSELHDLRLCIWQKIFSLYDTQTKDLMHFLLNYSLDCRLKISKIEKWDKDILIELIKKNFTKDNYVESKVVLYLCDLWSKHKIDYNETLRQDYQHEFTEIERIMYLDYMSFHIKNKEFSLKESDAMIKNELNLLIQNYKIEDFDKLFNMLSEIKEYNLNNNYHMERNLDVIFKLLHENYVDKIPKVANLLFTNKYDLKFNETNIIMGLLSVLEKNDVLTQIFKSNHIIKDKLIFAFYRCLDEKSIINEDIKGLLNLYNTCNNPFDLPYHLDFLEKYLCLDNSILIKISKLLYEKSKEDKNYLVGLTILFNSNINLNKHLIDYFKKDIDLLKNLYLVLDNYEQHFDYDARTMSNILDIDNKFITEYLKYDKSNMKKHREYNLLWEREDFSYIMTQVVDFMCEHTDIFSSDLILFFSDTYRGDNNHTILQKQKDFLTQFLKDNINNNKKIECIFSILISELSNDIKKEYVEIFLSLNKDIEYFRKLSLEPSIMSFSGSAVPEYKKKIDFFISLLDLIKGVDFLEHKIYIESIISSKKSRIKEEEKRDFMDDF